MKTVKIYKKIVIIVSIISFISTIIGWFFFLDKIGVIDIQDLLIESGEDSGYSSDKVEAILQVAEKIKVYIAKEKWIWSTDTAHFNHPRYNSGNNTKTCCATYVAYVLKEVELMDENMVINDVGTFDNFLGGESGWEKLTGISDFSQLEPGDICIHTSTQNRTRI